MQICYPYKFRSATGTRKPTEDQAIKIAVLLDEVSPRSVFKELDTELRKMNGAKKRK
jgi:hypothetical protein